MAQPLPAAQSHAELAGIDAVARPRVHIDAQPALAARLPLSQQALDARVAVARPTRPVIHVTIDRIVGRVELNHVGRGRGLALDEGDLPGLGLRWGT